MKSLFTIALIVLGAALLLTRWSEPDMRSDVPVLYWVIDPAPVRAEHIRLFHRWQIDSGNCTEHELKDSADVESFRHRRWSPGIAQTIREGNDQGAAILDGTVPSARLPLTVRVPKAELRLDAASNDMSKKLIQGVSGVAGDIMEAYGSGGVQYLASGGLVADLTDDARRLGFGPEMTYPALQPAFSYEGRQYAFPRNPNTEMYWVNKDTFARYGQPLPPRRWTIEEFEARGKAFVAAANPEGQRRTAFFADRVDIFQMRRSLGLDVFNETLTRCVLDDERCARIYALILKWVEVDHILPSNADRASFSTQAGGWGSLTGQLFANGTIGLLLSGRYQLMQFRNLTPLPLAVVEPPNGGFPNTSFGSGEATVYRGSKYPELAVLFLAFYASEAYSMQIVRDGDGLPPIPKYTLTGEYLYPADYTNEWGCHEVFATDALHNAIVTSFSPFVQAGVVERYEWMMLGAVLAGRMTPGTAAREIADRINREIELAVEENPGLQVEYEVACSVQERIEQYRRDDRPVPAAWVRNPFLQRVYTEHGWLERDAIPVAAVEGVSMHREESTHAHP